MDLKLLPSSGRLLLTGATGFVGGAVAAALLPTSFWPNVLMAVRAPTADAGRGRVRESLARFVKDPALLARIDTNQILPADIGRPDTYLADRRLDAVTHVIGSAAVTSFGTHPAMEATNIRGAIALAQRFASSPHLRRFVHVGTAMVCGADSPQTVAEHRYEEDEVRHLVNYTRTKLAGENGVRAAIADQRLVVARPSICVGHSQLGCAPSGSIFWTFRIATALRMVPFSLDIPIDVMPVDYAASALLHLAFTPAPKHRLYHISAGPAASSSYRDIFRAMDAAEGRHPAAIREVTLADMSARQNEFPALLGPGNPRLIFKAIRLYSNFAELGKVFDNQRLLDEGLSLPSNFASYAGLCLTTSGESDIFEQLLSDLSVPAERVMARSAIGDIALPAGAVA
ncbi:MAG: SDR family oxidoreductase [Rhodospirillales bacterium]|nr:SDR family oxidoreductase [Rhodospirillales bacterium]